MKLHQLRYFVGVVDNGFSVSRAALAIHTSQPGISKQVNALERALGVELFVRRRTRLIGLTTHGEAVLSAARRMLRDADTLARVARSTTVTFGELVIATTQVHARYVLIDIVERFRRRYPDVQLVFRQGTPDQIAEMVNDGDADLGIGAEPSQVYPHLVLLPGFPLRRSLFVPANHELLGAKGITMQQLARYPLVSLELTHTGGVTVLRAFESAGLRPKIVLRAADPDVVKAYVIRGLGIAVLPAIAYEPKRDKDLRAIPVDRLFPPTVARLEVSRQNVLQPYLYDFITMISPKLKRQDIERLITAR